MTNKLVLSVATILLLTSSSFAQTTADKINKNSYEVGRTNNAVRNGVTSVKDTKETVKEVGGMIKDVFGKKRAAKKEAETSPPEASTQLAATSASGNGNVINISIAKIDYTKLKELEDNLKSITGVSKTTKQFSATSSSIDIYYAGPCDQLWDSLPAQTRKLFVLKDLKETSIALEMKK